MIYTFKDEDPKSFSEADVSFFLTHFKGLAPADLTELLAPAEFRTLPAGQVWLAQGATSQKLAYITKGIIRSYSIGDNEIESTLLLRWEHQFIAAIDSLLYAAPSRYIYETLEETTIVELNDSAWAIIDRNTRLSAVRGHLLLLMLGQAMDRVESFVLLSPEQRYRKLLDEKPDIVNRVPDKHLSTYLGITPVSLSRIRRRMAQR